MGALLARQRVADLFRRSFGLVEGSVNIFAVDGVFDCVFQFVAIRQIEFALYIELARRSRADRRKVRVYKRQNRPLSGTGFQLIEQSRGFFAFEERMAAELHAIVFNGFSFNLPAA